MLILCLTAGYFLGVLPFQHHQKTIILTTHPHFFDIANKDLIRIETSKTYQDLQLQLVTRDDIDLLLIPQSWAIQAINEELLAPLWGEKYTQLLYSDFQFKNARDSYFPIIWTQQPSTPNPGTPTSATEEDKGFSVWVFAVPVYKQKIPEWVQHLLKFEEQKKWVVSLDVSSTLEALNVDSIEVRHRPSRIRELKFTAPVGP